MFNSLVNDKSVQQDKDRIFCSYA